MVTSMLLSALLVGSQGLDAVPAAVLAAARAWLAMALVDQRNERSTSRTANPEVIRQGLPDDAAEAEVASSRCRSPRPGARPAGSAGSSSARRGASRP